MFAIYFNQKKNWYFAYAANANRADFVHFWALPFKNGLLEIVKTIMGI